MLRRRAAAILILALPLAACGDSGFKEGFEEGFDKGAREKFISGCVSGITKVDAQTATDLCACMSDYMSERLTAAEMLNPIGGKAERVEGEAIDACIAKITQPQG